jgi:hypothetical protein
LVKLVFCVVICDIFIYYLTARPYNEFFLLEYNVMESVESRSEFRKNRLPPSSGLRVSQASNKHEVDSNCLNLQP